MLTITTQQRLAIEECRVSSVGVRGRSSKQCAEEEVRNLAGAPMPQRERVPPSPPLDYDLRIVNFESTPLAVVLQTSRLTIKCASLFCLTASVVKKKYQVGKIYAC